MLIAQIPPPPGVDPLAGWIIAALLGALSTVFFIWQRQTAAESKRKDELIDRRDAELARLVDRMANLANAQETNNDVTRTAIEVARRGTSR